VAAKESASESANKPKNKSVKSNFPSGWKYLSSQAMLGENIQFSQSRDRSFVALTDWFVFVFRNIQRGPEEEQ
jgi:hypothetical protein